jgi:hypothetical protein
MQTPGSGAPQHSGEQPRQAAAPKPTPYDQVHIALCSRHYRSMMGFPLSVVTDAASGCRRAADRDTQI